MAQDRPLPVPVGVVETLIMSTDGAGRLCFAQDLRMGQRVRLVNGPFAETAWHADRLDNKGRVEVLLDIMGKGVRVKLQREWVEPAM